MKVTRVRKHLSSIEVTVEGTTDPREARAFALAFRGETLDRFYGSDMKVYADQNIVIVDLWTS